jgi:predicted O-methyltransferase YrrM
MIKYIAALNQKSLVGAEVGVGSGANSLSILQTLDLKHLHCVDPSPPYQGKETKNIPTPAKDHAFATLKDKPVVWHIEASLDAAKKIDEPLDFVYIDGLHDYKSVTDDIAAWYPLVRKGGVVGGHDFTIQGEDVIDAVTKFAVDANLYLNIDFPDWWVIRR